METYIVICKIDSQWEFAVQLRKLKQGLCINLEGWVGEGVGREIQKGRDLCIPMTEVEQKTTKFCKATIQLKKIKNSLFTFSYILICKCMFSVVLRQINVFHTPQSY